MVDLKSVSEDHAALRDAIEAFFFGYRAFTGPPDLILQRQGLGRVHHRILYFVGRRPGLSVKGLLEILAVSKQAIHAPLRQLVELDLVAATPGADKRVKVLRLTPQGLALEAELTGVQMDQMARAFAGGGADGWMRVMRALGEG